VPEFIPSNSNSGLRLHAKCHLNNKTNPLTPMLSVLRCCWLGGRKGIHTVKKLSNGVLAQLMPLPCTVSCFSKIQTGFTFLAPAYLGNPGQNPESHKTVVCMCNSRFALTPITTLVHNLLVTGFMQPLQTNAFITLYMLPIIPLYFLCIHF